MTIEILQNLQISGGGVSSAICRTRANRQSINVKESEEELFSKMLNPTQSV